MDGFGTPKMVENGAQIDHKSFPKTSIKNDSNKDRKQDMFETKTIRNRTRAIKNKHKQKRRNINTQNKQKKHRGACGKAHTQNAFLQQKKTCARLTRKS